MIPGHLSKDGPGSTLADIVAISIDGVNSAEDEAVTAFERMEDHLKVLVKLMVQQLPSADVELERTASMIDRTKASTVMLFSTTVPRIHIALGIVRPAIRRYISTLLDRMWWLNEYYSGVILKVKIPPSPSPSSTYLWAVLIIMHAVSSQGVNLDRCCSRVLVVTNPTNAPLEWQSWGRIIRVSQPNPVKVIRIIVTNSHYLHRESRQMDKSIIDLATRSFSDGVRNLLVDLLNEDNKTVKDAHSSLKLTNWNPETDPYEQGPELGPEDTTGYVSRRETKAPERFGAFTQTFTSINDDGEEDDDEDLKDGEYNDELADDTDHETDKEEFEGDDELRINVEDTALEPARTRTLRTEFGKLSAQEQELYDQENLNMRQLLAFDPDRVYTTSDLEEEIVLERALRLLYLSKFGRETLYTRISPHIKYDKLPASMAQAIEARLEVEDAQIRHSLMLISGDSRLQQLPVRKHLRTSDDQQIVSKRAKGANEDNEGREKDDEGGNGHNEGGEGDDEWGN